MSLIGSDVILELQYSIGKVSEETITERIQLFDMIINFMIESFVLAPNIAVELDILLKILGSINLVDLDVLFIIDEDFLMSEFKGLEVFHDVVVVLKSHLGDFPILVGLFEQGLEGVIGEEVGLDEIFEVMVTHCRKVYTCIIIILSKERWMIDIIMVIEGQQLRVDFEVDLELLELGFFWGIFWSILDLFYNG